MLPIVVGPSSLLKSCPKVLIEVEATPSPTSSEKFRCPVLGLQGPLWFARVDR